MDVQVKTRVRSNHGNVYVVLRETAGPGRELEVWFLSRIWRAHASCGAASEVQRSLWALGSAARAGRAFYPSLWHSPVLPSPSPQSTTVQTGQRLQSSGTPVHRPATKCRPLPSRKRSRFRAIDTIPDRRSAPLCPGASFGVFLTCCSFVGFEPENSIIPQQGQFPRTHSLAVRLQPAVQSSSQAA